MRSQRTPFIDQRNLPLQTTLLIIMRKFIFGALVIVSSISSAFASSGSNRCIIGGRYNQTDVEKAIESQMQVQSVTITKSKWGASAANPMSWAIDWNTDYRTMSLVISDHGTTAKHTDCSANYDRTEKTLNIYGCDDESMFRQGIYANYAADTVIFNLKDLKPCK
jgi:hypothetical protein